MNASNTSNTSANKINAAIISSCTWDDPMTDMACAYWFCYDLYLPDTKTFAYKKVWAGGPTKDTLESEYNIVKLTDEMRTEIREAREAAFQHQVDEDFKKFTKELEEYNASRRPQQKGQTVKLSGGRVDGYVGKVTWFGKDKFKNSRTFKAYNWKAEALNAMCSWRPWSIPNAGMDLIGVRPLEGETFPNGKAIIYIDPARSMVIEGFSPISITREACEAYRSQQNDNFEAWGSINCYDHRSFM